MAASERDVRIGDRVLRVREAGDLDGSPIIYFHGTPGSRLDNVWGEDKAAEHHVRLVTFDRPGYGGSSVSPFGLTAVGEVACQIADELGVTRFASLGMSGGGPFSLATAAVAPDRVTVVGVASGVGPIMEVPGSDDLIDDADRGAHALLPGDPVAAAAMFAQSFEPMIGHIFAGDADESEGTSDSGDEGDGDGDGGQEPPFSPRDVEILADPSFGPLFNASLREGLRNGAAGCGWDNVAWVGHWDIDLAAISCPVNLWYGEEDHGPARPALGQWLHEHLPTSELTLRHGEGHFGFFDHFGEMLDALAVRS
jgi:pimeloyl-ACP methyl ester carboxylesterase